MYSKELQTKGMNPFRKLIFECLAVMSILVQLPILSFGVDKIPQETTLLNAIEAISKDYEVYFTFDMTLVSNIKVHYEKRNYSSAEEAISRILEGTKLTYKFYDHRFVIIYKNNEEGLESLKKMAKHLDGLISDGEKAKSNRKVSNRVTPKLTPKFESQRLEKFAININGTVISPAGEPLIGVNVLVKGTDKGTATDFEGNFTLEDVDEQAVLVVSYIGYQTQEIPVAGKSKITITLLEDSQTLDEVVVVGFGTQKKVNLTGAVSTVGSKDLESRTVTKSSLALQGQMSGISVRQPSGNPRSNDASLTVRGQGTFSGAGSNPLVLVDGIESSINNVDPSDIESISVLKDAASAAIFGSKAANGVILIETKSGVTGKPQFSYNSYIGQQSPTMVPEMVNSWEYAIAANEASPGRFSEEEIQKFRSGSDPLNYPNFDHIDYLFGSGSGFETKHDMSVRGGTEIMRYMVSAGYYDQQGIIKKNNADRYNLRINLDSELQDNLLFSVKIAGNRDNGSEPSYGYGPGVSGIINGAMRNSNAILGVMPDGYYGRNETLHPEADLNSKSFLETIDTDLYGNSSMTWKIIPGLEIMGQVGYTYSNNQYKAFQANYPITPNYGIARNSLTTTWSSNSLLTLQSILRYNKDFKNHSIKLLGGYSSQVYNFNNVSAYRDDFPNNEIYEIDAGATARGTQGGTASRNKLASLFGRLNYDFLDKYLFELNFRYDGSSRFPSENRWGLFPSASVGWRISEENFIKESLPWIYNLKVRASWGELGNQSIGNYPYQDLISLGQNYPFGSELSAGAAVNTIANKEITWETTQITDIGLDMGVMNGRLNFSIDYFVKRTTDILYNVSVSNLLGATPSATNAGTVSNKGWDFDIGFNDVKGDFSYGLRAIFSLVNNEVEKLANIEQDINRGLFIGYPIGSSFGYTSDGLFANDEEVANYATQPFSFLAEAGGIKYVDISGPNGVPDGVVNSTYDRTIIGQPLPTSTYALTLNAGYKNFDLNILLQGEGGRKDMINLGQFFFPLENNGNVQREAFENRWTFDNPDVGASYPRMKNLNSGFYRSNPVDYWYRDATFIRLKNVQLGYSLPGDILQNTFLNKVRFYVTAENLFTLTEYYEGWDPEMQTSGSFYPLTKLFVGGVNINF
ncbi:SusC/RagA family TonB-linked outer membrane protein [Membranihabitans maritimus]|uniref:SusC/RagA family TonB-linked outer membrane protein n=1 Tax=Membranihabitans maritimus TaxID=2904244 RepID=UPI001F39B084|nr:TonB-dependent receptor [Membranihabitans maritimus]